MIKIARFFKNLAIFIISIPTISDGSGIASWEKYAFP